MAKFNADHHEFSSPFTCLKCGNRFPYHLASNGCPKCGHYLFKIATRSGTPAAWDKDRPDPYKRQKQDPVDSNQTGSGYKLTTPGDEEDGFGGMGSRFRGGLAPHEYSQTSTEYQDQLKKDLPSEDTNLDHPPTEGTPLKGWFSDPEDSLSSTQQMNRDMSNTDQKPLDSQLAKQRTNQSLKTRLDDSIFGQLAKKLKGVRR